MAHVAQVLEVIAFALVTAGVFMLAGTGWALLAGGVLLALLAHEVERSRS